MERERDRREEIKKERALLGYNHSLSSEMTYKLAYSGVLPLQGKRQLSYANSAHAEQLSKKKKKSQPGVSDRSVEESERLLSARLSRL